MLNILYGLAKRYNIGFASSESKIQIKLLEMIYDFLSLFLNAK